MLWKVALLNSVDTAMHSIVFNSFLWKDLLDVFPSEDFLSDHWKSTEGTIQWHHNCLVTRQECSTLESVFEEHGISKAGKKELVHCSDEAGQSCQSCNTAPVMQGHARSCKVKPFQSQTSIHFKTVTAKGSIRICEVDILRIHVLGREYDALRSGERFFAEGKVPWQSHTAKPLTWDKQTQRNRQPKWEFLLLEFQEFE